MIDSPDEIRRAFDDDVDLAPETRERIFRGAVKGVRRARTRQNVIIAGSALVAMLALAWAYGSWPSVVDREPAPIATNVMLREPGHAARALYPDERIRSGSSEVTLTFAGGTSVRAEPATIIALTEPTPPRVALETGNIEASGPITVTAPGCSCRISGIARIEAQPALLRTQIVIIAGSVEAEGPRCTVSRIDLPAAAPVPVEPVAPPTIPEIPEPAVHARRVRAPIATAPIATAPTPSPVVEPAAPSAQAILAQRVDRFERARAHIATDPARAERELRALQHEWSDCPIENELESALREARAAPRGP